MVSGFVVGSDDAENLIAATRGGEEGLRALLEVVVEVDCFVEKLAESLVVGLRVNCAEKRAIVDESADYILDVLLDVTKIHNFLSVLKYVAKIVIILQNPFICESSGARSCQG